MGWGGGFGGALTYQELSDIPGNIRTWEKHICQLPSGRNSEGFGVERKGVGWGVTPPGAVTVAVRPAFEEGRSRALTFEMCRFESRAEFLRTVEEMKLYSTTNAKD